MEEQKVEPMIDKFHYKNLAIISSKLEKVLGANVKVTSPLFKTINSTVKPLMFKDMLPLKRNVALARTSRFAHNGVVAN